jgi:hypothetical protein
MEITNQIAKEVDAIEPVWGFEPIEEVEDFGRCSRCGEMAELKDPCCNAPLWFEGELEWGRIEEEE